MENMELLLHGLVFIQDNNQEILIVYIKTNNKISTSEIYFNSFVVCCQHFHDRKNNRNKKEEICELVFCNAR